jgi:hypothetical protein
MDKIEIKITRNCDAEGNGGEVVDHAAAILGEMSSGVPIVDAIVAAFADAYGMHEIDEKPVSGYRNVAFRMRQHMTDVVSAYAQRQAQQAAQAQAQTAVNQALGSVTILDGK